MGVAVAAAGAVGDVIVKKEGFAAFRPRLHWVALIVWEPWYVIKGTVLALRELARTLAGRQPHFQFRIIPYRYGGQNETAAGKRALFSAYVTISPDTIVVGLDQKRELALLHLLGSEELPEIARELGARV